MNEIPVSLTRARQHWRVASLMPYFSVAFAVILLLLLLSALFELPLWLAAVTGGFFVVAALIDGQWRLPLDETCSKLDARFAELQDSSGLLLQDPEQLSPLARLQRSRTADTLQQLLNADRLKVFHPASLRSPLLAAIGATLGLASYVALGQLQGASTADRLAYISGSGTERAQMAQPILEAVTTIEPPAYTNLPRRTQSLDVQAPEGSRVTWRITLEQPAYALRMVAAEKTFDFATQEALPSRSWKVTRTLLDTDFYQLSLLENNQGNSRDNYRLQPEIYNIELEPDRPPEYTFDYPKDNVTVVNGERGKQASLLNVSVSVSDDYQLVEADLLLTLASGSGENVRFRNERIKLQPASIDIDADGSTNHYRFNIPVERYEIESGDELYWYLEARDNRTPEANVRKSQHFIIRWPQEEIFGLSDAEGMAIKILPEYFRSQRQLIIDTEALLEQEKQITPQAFRKRAENLAYEQNLLRMRYGRFLGEEDSAMEHSDDSAEAEETHGDQDDHTGHDDADSHAGESSQRFGDATGVVAAAGHQHDSSEHATLFDPQTKELLRSALNAMWSAWRDLSVIEPRASLPHQHSALRYIKEVQQASRIYLQRVGFEAPALDETRRLSGEMEEITPPRVTAQRDHGERAQVLALLQTLRRNEPIDEAQASTLQQLSAVKDSATTRIELAKQLRRYRQQPACDECRQALSSLLYQLLPAPLAEPGLPNVSTEHGSYRQWLQQQGEAR